MAYTFANRFIPSVQQEFLGRRVGSHCVDDCSPSDLDNVFLEQWIRITFSLFFGVCIFYKHNRKLSSSSDQIRSLFIIVAISISLGR